VSSATRADIGGAIGIWRDLFDDGDVVAHSGIALIKRQASQGQRQ
jgi:hypothetical protein